MRRLRGIARATRAIAVTLCLYLAWLAGHLTLVFARERRPRWRRRVMRRWCAAMCRALAVEVRVAGSAPGGGALLVCNHLSYLDIVVIGSALDTVFVSKAEIADWPGIGFLAREFGTIFLARSRKRELPGINEQIARALAGGEGVVVFPEGTSTKGADVLAFRPSLLAPAAAANIPVHWAALTYAVPAGEPRASDSVCWWGEAAFLPHVRGLLQLRAIEARLDFGPQALSSADRKQLAESLRLAVQSRFRPMA